HDAHPLAIEYRGSRVGRPEIDPDVKRRVCHARSLGRNAALVSAGVHRAGQRWRYTMKPRVGSYGETATVTRSPSTTRIRWRRTLPASFARTSWPLSSLTRKLPPFAIRMT